jgi:hypothetical protein
MIKISITNAHGTFTTTTSALDLIIDRYLPASALQLQRVLSETTGTPERDYDDVHAVSELLVMLADADGYAYEDGNVIPGGGDQPDTGGLTAADIANSNWPAGTHFTPVAP